MKAGKRRLRARVMVLVAVALALVVAMAWGMAQALAADETSPSPGGKVTLRVGWTNDPDNLNPFIGYESSSFEVWHLNYDMLVGYKPDGSPAPEMAESWTTSPDGLTWTFKIRQGMTWQDGQPVTAKDVAFTFNYIVENNLTAYSAYTALIKEAKVVDDYTVDVVCTKPKANMLRMYVHIVPEHIWSKVPPKEAETNYRNKPPIVGSGPFQCVEWQKGDFVRMVKNPDYWRGAAVIDEIIFQTYTNSDSMAADLMAGRLDAAMNIPTAQFQAIDDSPDLEAISFPLLNWEYLSFNCYEDPASQGHPVLRDMKFRQALSWAIDRQKCADLGWSGFAAPGTTIIPPDQWPADFDAHYEPTPEETYGFDIAKANQLLDEAGYTDSDGNGIREYEGKDIVLRLWSRTEEPASQKQGKLIADWLGQCGLKIQYQVMDDGAMSERLYAEKPAGTYAPDYDLYIWDWVGYADPGDTLASFTTDQIWMWNDPCWSNAEFDQLAVDQYSELDKQKRLEMLHRMQQIFYVEAPEVVLDYPDYLEAINTAKWDGWVRYTDGGAFYTNYNIDSYLNLKPKAAAATTEEGTSNTLWIVLGVVAAVVVIALVVWLARRGRGRAVEE